MTTFRGPAARLFGEALTRFRPVSGNAGKKLYKATCEVQDFIDAAGLCGVSRLHIHTAIEISAAFGLTPIIHVKWFVLLLLRTAEQGSLRMASCQLASSLAELIAPLTESKKHMPYHDKIKNEFSAPSFLEDAKASRLVSVNSDSVIILKGGFFYLHSMYHNERAFLGALKDRLSRLQHPLIENISYSTAEIKKLLKGLEKQTELQYTASQLEAIHMAVRHDFLIITGGPGTGKTTVIAAILLILKNFETYRGQPPEIVLAAPTGRAAIRMRESLSGAIPANDTTDSAPDGYKTSTLHRLIGLNPGSDSKPYHNGGNPVQADIIIVDEASMADVHMMRFLLEALPARCKLVLIGDKDQLPSVEAGAFLTDLTTGAGDPAHKLHEHIVFLDKSKRSRDSIINFSHMILEHKLTTDLFDTPGEHITMHHPDSAEKIIAGIITQEGYDTLPSLCKLGARSESLAADTNKLDALYNKLSASITASPVRKGPWGTRTLNYLFVKKLAQSNDTFFPGFVCMQTRNDYDLGIFNGDRGLFLRCSDGLFCLFRKASGEYRLIRPERLDSIEPAFAITVHKSQGSEYDSVHFVLAESESRVHTVEIVYTAVTRAKDHLHMYTSFEVLKNTIKRRIYRDSGIREYLNASGKARVF